VIESIGHPGQEHAPYPENLGCGTFQQAASATSYVEQPFTGPQEKLPANLVKLLPLGKIDILFTSAKVCAGVDHPPIEPDTVKLVPDVVVMTYIGSVLMLGAQSRKKAC
jgi:hypothetical protein